MSPRFAWDSHTIRLLCYEVKSFPHANTCCSRLRRIYGEDVCGLLHVLAREHNLVLFVVAVNSLWAGGEISQQFLKQLYQAKSYREQSANRMKVDLVASAISSGLAFTVPSME